MITNSKIPEQIEDMRAFFRQGQSRDPSYRRSRLIALRAKILEREPDIMAALHADLGKSPAESYMTEVGEVLAELRQFAKRSASWSQRKFVWPDPPLMPAPCWIYPEPFGVVLVFSPWNYPFQLSLLPLAAAIAAGNCVALKPSRRAPATARILADIITDVFDRRHCAVFISAPEPGEPEATANALLREKFDYIFYTGSERVGKLVMAAASTNLVPVCLELGGQSPVIVARDANLELAAKRIAWGKILNAGQTCVAPDYVVADNAIREELKRLIESEFANLLGDNPLASANYARIISQAAFDRLCKLAEECGLALVADKEKLKIAPIVFDASDDSPAMTGEIFGPLLPILGYDEIHTAFHHIHSRPKPLALYIFTTSATLAERALKELSFGGGCVNDVVLQASSRKLPFGGVGQSGMGRYHGRAGFELFSNMKSVVWQWPRFDLPFRYPPHTKLKSLLVRWLLR